MFLNVNKQQDHGVELETSVRFYRQASFRFWYAYTHGEIEEDLDDGRTQSTYNLIRRPRHSYRFSFSYSPIASVRIRSDIQAYGDRIDTDFSTEQQVTLGGYFLWGAYISYTPASFIRLFVDAKNLLNNTTYEETYGYTALPIQVVGGLSIHLFEPPSR